MALAIQQVLALRQKQCAALAEVVVGSTEAPPEVTAARRDAGLDEHGAPREWMRDDDDDDDDALSSGARRRATEDASNATLAVRWRLAYKRAVQAAYRLAQARVDEAVEAIGAAGRGDASASSSDARVAKPRLRAAR